MASRKEDMINEIKFIGDLFLGRGYPGHLVKDITEYVSSEWGRKYVLLLGIGITAPINQSGTNDGYQRACILGYSQYAGEIRNIIEKNWNIITSDETLSGKIEEKPTFVYKTGMNIKTMIESRSTNKWGRNISKEGTKKCGHCNQCSYMMEDEQICLDNIMGDGMLHWKHAKKAEEIDDPSPSVEVEIAAYVLLALMSVPNPSSDDFTSAAMIVKWITKQQGPYGGFDSTQDTVVALQALSKYSGWAFNGKSHVTVSIRSKKNVVENFVVNNNNRLLLQRATLTDIPGNYTAEISGDGCILLQTTLKYNIPPPVKVSAFAIQVETDPSNCTSLSVVNFNVIITVSYTGERNVSNMAIIEVKMLSGYIPDKKSVKKLQSDNPVVQRTEVKTHEVIIYLEELSHETKKFVFHVEEEIPVKNLKPAMVKIYDYYNERADNAVTQYTAPCSKKAET
ncbi:alpha-2-macroglobulin-like [Protopterus annectens]|uniref:alpha-2-macroglobulin-like n=1 Tax=Protopterus annectens TaxID=7888 RepID=UPI001CFC3340|nr:alpha-2-macroglobulin-like [Protopterus annectens]